MTRDAKIIPGNLGRRSHRMKGQISGPNLVVGCGAQMSPETKQGLRGGLESSWGRRIEIRPLNQTQRACRTPRNQSVNNKTVQRIRAKYNSCSVDKVESGAWMQRDQRAHTKPKEKIRAKDVPLNSEIRNHRG